MGTIASLRVEQVSPTVFSQAERRVRESLDAWQAEFTRYDPASPASRIASGDLALPQSSEWHRDVYAQAVDWRNRTGGAFDPHRPDGSLDLAGIVKALAMQSAGAILTTSGCLDWCLNVGGDVLAAGLAEGRPWSVGLVDPRDRAKLHRVVTLSGDRSAVATSGSAERGDHIWGHGSGPRVLQCSVIAASIVVADVLATAIVAGDRDFALAAAAEYGVGVRVTFDDGTELTR